MQNIDFLPARYHEQSESRKNQAWRIGVIALFGGSILAAAVFQFGLRRFALTQLATIAGAYDAATVSQQRLNELNGQVASAKTRAELYLYLQHPWPRTQVLAAISSRVTESITLAEIQILREIPRRSSTRRGTTRPEVRDEAAPATSPAQQDLQVLRGQCDPTPVIVNLVGKTTDVAELHRFFETLNTDGLITRAELSSLESVDSDGGEALRFRARIVLRPGYSQPDGPSQAADRLAGKTEDRR